METDPAWAGASDHATQPAKSRVDVGPLSVEELQQLLVEVLPAAYGYALRLTRNRADAEDLVQEAALRACRARESFTPGTNFKAWLFQILTRCQWAGHRQSKRRPATVEIDDVPELNLYSESARHGLPYTGSAVCARSISWRTSPTRRSPMFSSCPSAPCGPVCTAGVGCCRRRFGLRRRKPA
jgi:hypothetical protein